MNRPEIMNQIAAAERKITDLRDLLENSVPSKDRKAIVQHINDLSDFIFYSQEYLSEGY